MLIKRGGYVVEKQGYYYKIERSEMLKYIPVNINRSLEVGCAEGNFSSLVKKHLGVETWGIEIDEKSARIAAEKLDHVIVKDVFKSLDELPLSYFDCIIFNDILEHLEDPWKLLVDIKKYLSEGGVVVASIPNVRYCSVMVDYILNGNWNYAEWGVLDNTHLRFFTYKSINKMFLDLGYEILQIEGIHPTNSIRFKLLNFFLLGLFKDARYMQFACVAKPIKNSLQGDRICTEHV